MKKAIGICITLGLVTTYACDQPAQVIEGKVVQKKELVSGYVRRNLKINGTFQLLNLKSDGWWLLTLRSEYPEEKVTIISDHYVSQTVFDQAQMGEIIRLKP